MKYRTKRSSTRVVCCLVAILLTTLIYAAVNLHLHLSSVRFSVVFRNTRLQRTNRYSQSLHGQRLKNSCVNHRRLTFQDQSVEFDSSNRLTNLRELAILEGDVPDWYHGDDDDISFQDGLPFDDTPPPEIPIEDEINQEIFAHLWQ